MLKNLFDLSDSPDLWLACFAPGLVRDMSYLKQKKLPISQNQKKKNALWI